MDGLHIRRLVHSDPEPIANAFAAVGWTKPVEQYVRYLAEQETGRRICFVAEQHDVFAGYCTLLWERLYVRRGYVPDGRGVMYANQTVAPGDSIRIDDGAILMLTRVLCDDPGAVIR